MAESDFWGKSPVHSADTLWVKHFIKIAVSHRFRAKCAFVFYEEIQDGRQKWAGKRLLKKVVSRLCMYPAHQKFHQNRSTLHRFRGKFVFLFYAEIQDGHQKWRESDFWEKLPVHSAHTLGVENFVKI